MAVQQLTPTTTRSRSRIAVTVAGSLLLSAGLLAAALTDWPRLLDENPPAEDQDPAAEDKRDLPELLDRDQEGAGADLSGGNNFAQPDGDAPDLVNPAPSLNLPDAADCQTLIDQLAAGGATVNELPICPLDTPLFSSVEPGQLGLLNSLVTNRGEINGQRVIIHFSLGSPVTDNLFAGNTEEGQQISAENMRAQVRRVAGGQFGSPDDHVDPPTIYRSAETHPLPFYVVLETLDGGDPCTPQNQIDEFVCGNARYELRVGWNNNGAPFEAGGQEDRVQFTTLNRLQTIAYNYSVVFGEDFDGHINRATLTEDDLAQIIVEHPELAGRIDGVQFYNTPPAGQSPIDLASMKFVLMGDRTYEEFEHRIRATSERISVDAAIQQLYRSVFDRIYPNDLARISDDEGRAFWRNLIENGPLNEYGVTFNMLASEEYYNQLLATATNAQDEYRLNGNYAYLTTLRRGPDNEGLDYMVREAQAVELDPLLFMRLLLIESDEFSARIGRIEEALGRPAMVEELYQTCLFRASDAEGVAYWASQDLTRDGLIDQFCTPRGD